MRACDSQAADPAINPRTGEPYKRGAYNKERDRSAAGAIAKLARQDAAKEAAMEKTVAARAELSLLRSEVQRLNKELEESKASIETSKRAAVLEATQKMAQELLQRYKDGLRDGASLSRGGLAVNLSSSRATPDSAHAESSPYSWA